MFPQTIRTWIIENVKVFGYYKKNNQKSKLIFVIEIWWLEQPSSAMNKTCRWRIWNKKLFKTGPDDQDCSPDAGFVWFVIIIDLYFYQLRVAIKAPPQALTDMMSKNVSFFFIHTNIIFVFIKFQAFFPPSTKNYIFLADKG